LNDVLIEIELAGLFPLMADPVSFVEAILLSFLVVLDAKASLLFAVLSTFTGVFLLYREAGAA